MSGLSTSTSAGFKEKAPWQSTALVAFALFFLMDAAVFRTGAYFALIKPASFAGMLLQRCQLAEQKKKEGGDLVAFVGDSRLREGFSSRTFDRSARAYDLSSLNLAVSGSTPRVWYYLLKAVDPDSNAFKMLVIGLPSYFDESYYDQAFADNKLDLQVMAPILKLSDSQDFSQSFMNQDLRNEMLLSSVLKMYAFRRDIKDLIVNPTERQSEAAYARQTWMKGDYYYRGQEGTMAGVHVENGKVVGLPENLDPTKKERMQTMLFLPPAPPDFDHSNYLSFWLERIVKRYQGKSTKIVFVHLPNEPLPSQTERPCIDRTIKKLAEYPNVVVASSDEFDELNNPKFFADDIHLNVKGRALFSQLLSSKVLEVAQSNAKTAASFTRKDF